MSTRSNERAQPTKVAKLPWSSPVVVPLEQPGNAVGNCTSGSGDLGTCNIGSAALTLCVGGTAPTLCGGGGAG